MIEPIPNRRERALKHGAEAVVDPTDGLVEQIEELTDGRMRFEKIRDAFDVAIRDRQNALKVMVTF